MLTPTSCASREEWPTNRPICLHAQDPPGSPFLPLPQSVATMYGVLTARKPTRSLLCLTLISAGYWVAGCAAALGPGYTIDKQEIRVRFVPDPQPTIRIEAEYSLRNTGNRPLTALELSLPGRRRFRFSDPRIEWDSETVKLEPSLKDGRYFQLSLPRSWPISVVHTLHLSIEFQAPKSGDGGLSFSQDAFFLPAEGWSPELLPERGIFATGGVPPNGWILTLRVPEGFLVHTGGRQSKTSRSGGELVFRTVQRPKDGYPFVVAGRFHATRLSSGAVTLNLWTRAPQDAAALRQATDSLVKPVDAYNAMFGRQNSQFSQLWVVDCPVVAGCFTSSVSVYSDLISERGEKPSAQMASLDTVMVDPSAGAAGVAAAGPALASSWLGYGQNPGFFQQDPPLSALPAFAASRGREAVEGHQVREETIRRALRAVPVTSEPKKPENEAVVRAKSLLFFFGLQDRYGYDAFDKALSHMLYARRGGGFDLDDLIAAFEQETHQNVAEFVRRWMKHPGVPADFRARYENAASVAAITKENP
jgi:hypothetical protein